MFSSDELALLQNTAKEDKKLHGVLDKKPSGGFYNQEKSKTVAASNSNINKLNQMKPPIQAKKPEPPKTSTQPKVEIKKPELPKPTTQPKVEVKKPEPPKPNTQTKVEVKN